MEYWMIWKWHINTQSFIAWDGDRKNIQQPYLYPTIKKKIVDLRAKLSEVYKVSYFFWIKLQMYRYMHGLNMINLKLGPYLIKELQVLRKPWQIYKIFIIVIQSSCLKSFCKADQVIFCNYLTQQIYLQRYVLGLSYLIC